MTRTKAIWELGPEELTDLIDPSLKFIKKLGNGVFAEVYLVENQDGLAALKIGKRPENNHFDIEKKALEELAGIKGIPTLYKPYMGREFYKALLKEYIPGEEVTIIQAQKDIKLQERIKKLLNDSIRKGVVIADFKGGNMILHKFTQQPYIIDFGDAAFIGENWFSRIAEEVCRDAKRYYFPDI